ncbi:hypothetical protein FOA43_000580 [Brettanomyces nanus]|uniref:Major facilitator superfamily (MFS) profile domain-containing protein n=1 Tax=Eeniella nana TaxID=13502 RepID=A0A875RZE8_EENNA|nr:uncharacterized protein FOA43_000580 [Brettanomyces nanus]QPG73272.1 hypothetical protein FOA43_000580 [Brettanomyces nanus]
MGFHFGLKSDTPVEDNPSLPEAAEKTDALVATDSVLHSETSESEGQTEETKGKWYHWFEPGTSRKEKKLILKLDFFLMIYMIISWFLKYLDQTNVSNAYVSGMKEDLNLNANQLSWFNTYYNIGVIIGSIPATILAGYFRPRFFLPAMDLLWSLCVLFVYKAQNAQTIYALRFLIGLFESASNPSNHYLIGCWYKKKEIMRRSNFFVLAGIIGQATSSYIQSGLISSMQGKNNLEAWRWLFIIDAIIGIPVILFGLIFLPDYPHNTTAFWLNDWEKNRALERIKEDGRVSHKLNFNLKYLIPVLKSWQIWTFSVGYSFWMLTAGNYMLQFFELYLKSLKIYSTSYVNNFPTILSGVNFVTMLSTGIICDLTQRRGAVCFSVGLIVLIGFIITATTPVDHISLRKAGYILTGTYGCYTPILAGWCNIVCGKNPILRAIAIPTMIVVGQIVSTPYQQHVFPSSEAPQYSTTHGFYYAIAFTACLLVWTGIGIPLLERHFKRRDQIQFDRNNSEKKNDQDEEQEDVVSATVAF